MKQLKTMAHTFWHVFTNTFSSLDYYKKIIKAPFQFSLKYYVSFVFIAVCISTIVLSITFLYPLSRFVQRLPSHIENVYPNELEMTIKNGALTTNVKEPYAISLDRLTPITDDLNKNVLGVSSDEPENFAVIDTKGSINNFKKYKTLILITKKEVSYEDGDGIIRTSQLSGVEDTTINQSYVHDMLARYEFYFKNFFIMAVLIAFSISLIGISLVKAAYMLFLALVILALSKIMGFVITYRKSMQLGMHLDTIAMVLFWVINETVGAIPVPFLYTMIIGVFAFFVIDHLKKAHE